MKKASPGFPGIGYDRPGSWPALQGGLVAGETGGHSEFPRDEFEAFATEGAEDGSGLARDRFSDSLAGIRGV